MLHARDYLKNTNPKLEYPTSCLDQQGEKLSKRKGKGDYLPTRACTGVSSGGSALFLHDGELRCTPVFEEQGVGSNVAVLLLHSRAMVFIPSFLLLFTFIGALKCVTFITNFCMAICVNKRWFFWNYMQKCEVSQSLYVRSNSTSSLEELSKLAFKSLCFVQCWELKLCGRVVLSINVVCLKNPTLNGNQSWGRWGSCLINVTYVFPQKCKI